MSTSTSILAYSDVREILDRALESPRGIEVDIPDEPGSKPGGKATYFRQRAYSFRALDRKANSKIYPPDDPMHATSIYDTLVVIHNPPSTKIQIRKAGLEGMEIREL